MFGRRRTIKCRDGYLLRPDDPYLEAHRLINRLPKKAFVPGTIDKQSAIAQQILRADPCTKIALVHAALRRLEHRCTNRPLWVFYAGNRISSLLQRLLWRKLPLSGEDVSEVLHRAAGCLRSWYPKILSLHLIVGHAERHVAEHGSSPGIRDGLKTLYTALYARAHGIADRKLLYRLGDLAGKPQMGGIEPGEGWSDLALEQLRGMDRRARSALGRLLDHANYATTARPSVEWLAEADRRLAQVDRAELEKSLAGWFAWVGKPGVGWKATDPRLVTHPTLISDRNGDILRGLLWACNRLDGTAMAQPVARVAEVCFTKIGGIGPRSVKVGNACIYALRMMPGMAPITELSQLRMRVKFRGATKLIDAALEAAAEREGMSRADLEEQAVPTFGLDADGVLRETLGAFTAELRIVGTHQTELRWVKEDGKMQKSVPATVKREAADAVKALKQTAKDIQQALSAQRDRIERLLNSERRLPLPLWRERYLDHPLLAHMSRRLIWHFTTGEKTGVGILHDGNLVDVNDQPLDGLSAGTQVRLWHPIGFDVDTVQAWRRWLEAHEVVQPFKQAHREVYILTDAERETDTYSNRFAAHIVRVSQLTALAQQRGWTGGTLVIFDPTYNHPPKVELPQWDLWVEFWLEPAGDDTTDAGIFLFAQTDQVRFYRTGETEPLPLAEVPALAFTEVMRDVDLFVGVTSIGNDPAWQNRGEGGHLAYWQAYSFGALSTSAATRREVLSTLIPRLKIANRCTLIDRFLVVRGERRTYKIHLGSGNVLMEPNDQYLCIVANQAAATKTQTGKVFLPFEGDGMLSVILSKAFLLADDTNITDRTIRNQIGWR